MNQRTEVVFALAKKVYARKLPQQKAANELRARHGFNVNSAKIMLTVYGRMMRGLEFKRALSSADMNYYLARILAEGGPASLENPLAALWKHIEYYETKNGVTLGALRDVYTRYAAVSALTSSDGLGAEFYDSVRKAQKLTADEREERLQALPRKPRSRPVTVLAFDRNPYVVAEVLARAHGICERCKSQAPFARRRDNTPYLEVHHKVRLADGGEDTVENALALCPNCHRLLHFGPAEM